MGLAGCNRAASDGWNTRDAAVAEYFDEASKLDLAPGWSWPADPGYQDVGPDGRREFYGVNLGRVDAAWYWQCSWARTYFSATTMTERATAMEQVQRLTESAFFKFGLVDVERDRRRAVLVAAAAGDVEELKSITELNCPSGPKVS